MSFICDVCTLFVSIFLQNSTNTITQENVLYYATRGDQMGPAHDIMSVES